MLNISGNYGAKGIEAFITAAQEEGVCIATTDTVPTGAQDSEYEAVIRNLNKTPSAKVVACFCEGQTATGLLRAQMRLNYTDRFIFIGR